MRSMLKKSFSRMFYLVPFSPWPFFMSCSVFLMLFGLVQKMHSHPTIGSFLGYLGFFGILVIATHWWYILILESTVKAFHTKVVQEGLKIAMLIFIISEVMFFFGFFWSFFQSSLAPTFYIGGVWPPKYLVTLNPWTFPLLNTFILLTSGATVTWAHQSLIESSMFLQHLVSGLRRDFWQESDSNYRYDDCDHQRKIESLKEESLAEKLRKRHDLRQLQCLDDIQARLQLLRLEADINHKTKVLYSTPRLDILCSLTLTIVLALIFTYIQNYEYEVTTFSIESIYGSVFFLLTGFHGFHVICGTIFLLTFLIRYSLSHFAAQLDLYSTSFIHFELAAWYWHFVDIVWIFLFIFVYWWGGA